jgi:uncharacterized membrane protein
MDIKYILMITLIVFFILLVFGTLIILPMWQMHMMMGGYSFPMFWFLIIILIPFVIVLIIYLLLSSQKIEKNYQEVKQYVYPLTDEERNIVEFLKQNNYRSTQKEIQQHFKLSKTKAHRILARLESRGIIIRTKRGREMLVVLKKEEVS